jgi:hypothetical protein
MCNIIPEINISFTFKLIYGTIYVQKYVKVKKFHMLAIMFENRELMTLVCTGHMGRLSNAPSRLGVKSPVDS